MWHTTTATEYIAGNSTMTALTALNRPVIGIPASRRITSWQVRWQVELGAGAGTYSTIATGTLAQPMQWVVAISYVPTGGAVPNLASSPDDADFLDASYSTDGYDRQTVNTAGTPAYKDLYSWRGHLRGRAQVNSGVGGTVYWHLWNVAGINLATGWNVFLRMTYA